MIRSQTTGFVAFSLMSKSLGVWKMLSPGPYIEVKVSCHFDAQQQVLWKWPIDIYISGSMTKLWMSSYLPPIITVFHFKTFTFNSAVRIWALLKIMVPESFENGERYGKKKPLFLVLKVCECWSLIWRSEKKRQCPS